MAKPLAHGSQEEWLALQNKIFTRWVAQKLAPHGIEMKDVTTGLANGVELITLVEVLSDKKFTGKLNKGAKIMKPQMIDNCAQALKFVGEVGVDMKGSKASAENLVDGSPSTAILGLIYSVMIKFMKIGDEDDQLNVKDALLHWAQSQVNSYRGVKVDNLTTSWHDGAAFLALIHKFRPKIIGDWDKLDLKDGKANLAKAFAGAERFFGLEQYLKPEDILKLDEKSMMVYVSEYYYGIAAQRKVDLAARRIRKLVTLTVNNDHMKAGIVENGKKLRARVAAIETKLGDRKVDNTMAGAKAKLEEFYSYKKTEKGEVFKDYLEVETFYNKLAHILRENKRPEWKAPEGCSIPELRTLLAHLEEEEAKRKQHLHEELNRQIKLANINGRHQARFDEISKWAGDKKSYLSTKEKISSVGEATYALSTLTAASNEIKAVEAHSVAELKKMGSELVSEKFEGSSEVQKRESDTDATFAELHKLAGEKKLVLDDDLAREKYADQVRGWNNTHQGKFDKLSTFVKEKTAYLQKKEHVTSVSEAKLQLSTLASYEEEKKLTGQNIAPLKTLGGEIRSAKYETKYSTWVFEHPEAVKAREDEIDSGFVELDKLSAHKHNILKDDLKREEFREQVEKWNQEHIDGHTTLSTWQKAKNAYLRVKEKIYNSEDAELQLSILKSYSTERKDIEDVSFPPLKKLGQEIRDAEYKTEFSSYKFPHPDQVSGREDQLAKGFSELDELAARKLAVLEDDLARELFREKLDLKNQQHRDKHSKLKAWVEVSKAYLEKKDEVNSVAEALTNLARIDAYFLDKKDQDAQNVGFKKLGHEIITEEYKSDLSSYKFPTPNEVTHREKEIDDDYANLDKLSHHKKAVLDDDLAREQYKRQVRRWNQQHVDKHKGLTEWIGVKKAYLETKEPVNSISDAEKNLSNWRAYEVEKKDKLAVNVAALNKLGGEIRSALYKTSLSEWKFETPQEVVTREGEIADGFKNLDTLSHQKKAVLDDDLAREQFREKLRLMNEDHKGKHGRISAWVAGAKTLLHKKEECDSIADANKNLAHLSAYEADKADWTNINVAALKKLGKEIITDEYKTALSHYVFPTPDEIKGREGNVDSEWEELTKLSTAKKAVLDGDLAREIKKEELRLQFANLAGDFERWTKDASTDAKSTHFGFTLEEVEAFKSALDKLDEEVKAKAEEKKGAYSKVWTDLTELKVTRNEYTSHNPTSLQKLADNVTTALQGRHAAYAAELARQKANDDLCKEFAAAAKAFDGKLNANKDAVNTSTKALEEQQADVQAFQKAAATDGELKSVQGIQAKIDTAGVVYNRHSLLTAVDCEANWNQYLDFLTTKNTNLGKEIEHKKLRGITPEQYAEIDREFKRFDTNSNGVLDAKEFRQVLYSLGEEKRKSEVQEIMDKYSGSKDSKNISYAAFKEFMIDQLGDSDTKDEIIQGFKLMARGQDAVPLAEMDLVLPDETIAFITKTAPPKEAGKSYFYTPWVEEVYSR